MEIGLGKKGLELSWQKDFPEEVTCELCTSEELSKTVKARIACVVMESHETNYISELRQKTDKIWPHDAMAFAVYICPKCGEIIAKWNQA